MKIHYKRNGGLEATICCRYSKVATLRQDIQSKLGVDTDFYLLWNGKLLNEDEQVTSLSVEPTTITIVPRVLGGKGGFGSMLRAIGAQIEKTTNRDACRDLSGRRLRDINEEQRLKKWFAKQAEREKEKVEAKKKKLDKLRQFAEGPALPKIDDQDYLQQRADMVEDVFESVDKGFEASQGKSPDSPEASSDSSIATPPEEESSSSMSNLEAEKQGSASKDNAGDVAGPSKSSQPIKKTIKKTMLDEDLDSGSSSDESSEVEEDVSPKKKSKLQ